MYNILDILFRALYLAHVEGSVITIKATNTTHITLGIPEPVASKAIHRILARIVNRGHTVQIGAFVTFIATPLGKMETESSWIETTC